MNDLILLIFQCFYSGAQTFEDCITGERARVKFYSALSQESAHKLTLLLECERKVRIDRNF